MIRILYLMMTCMILFSCNGNGNKSDVKVQKENKQTHMDYGVPALPQNIFLSLNNEVDYIDYIFYNLPFSMSQDDRASIQANIRLLSPEPLGKSVSLNCKPIGREFFQIDGNVAYEADLYFSDGCYGYVFLKNEKPIYANKISETGLKFYGNIINQALQMQNGKANGG